MNGSIRQLKAVLHWFQVVLSQHNTVIAGTDIREMNIPSVANIKLHHRFQVISRRNFQSVIQHTFACLLAFGGPLDTICNRIDDRKFDFIVRHVHVRIPGVVLSCEHRFYFFPGHGDLISKEDRLNPLRLLIRFFIK